MNNKVKPTAPEGEEILVKGYYKPCPEKIEFGFPNYNSLNTYKVYKTQGKEEYIVVPFTADFICGYFP